MPLGARSSALGPFASSPGASTMGHFGGNRASERSVAAAQGFNAVPGPAPRPQGQGYSPLGLAPHVALGPGDLTSANGVYDNSYGVGQQPAALPPSPMGYGAAYSPSDPCEPYRQFPSFACCSCMLSDIFWPSLRNKCSFRRRIWVYWKDSTIAGANSTIASIAALEHMTNQYGA